MRHVDGWSLLLGLVFGAVAVAALAGWLDQGLATPALWTPDVLIPTVLVIVGVALGAVVATIAARGRTRQDRVSPDGNGGRSGRASPRGGEGGSPPA